MPSILWVDDEIHFLKPQILLLEQKGFSVQQSTNGEEALDLIAGQEFDVVFLDENMPGLSGLETLDRLKAIRPHLPVVMITKSEEEHVMEDAIGAKIADYLIKPVNPNQVLLSVKKILEGRQLVSDKVTQSYRKDFTQISMRFMERLDPEEWMEVYRKLVYWDIELQGSHDKGMRDVLNSQFAEANVNFGKYVAKNYEDWVNAKLADRPLLSPDVIPQRVLPLLGEKPVFFLLIDCLRYDQWRTFLPYFSRYFSLKTEETFMAILPTATQYARNSIFSGLFPGEIAKKFPQYWVHDSDDQGKNLYEQELLAELLKRERKQDLRWSYTKILNADQMKDWAGTVQNQLHNDLNVVVINFIDMLAHARSEMTIIKELAPDEAALRSLSRSWLEHSSLLQALERLGREDITLVIATDHGVTRVKRPLKIIGDRETTTNLRYKLGRNLNYDEKDRHIYGVRKPEALRLPSDTLSGSYAFCLEDGYFVYPNNYNRYVNLYNDTFQHGGISLEEMVVPLAVLKSKR